MFLNDARIVGPLTRDLLGMHTRLDCRKMLLLRYLRGYHSGSDPIFDNSDDNVWVNQQ